MIQVKTNLEETMNDFFQNLLDKGIVDALVIPQSVLSDRSYAHTLVSDSSKIKSAAPFVPVLMNNGATLVASLKTIDMEKKIGAVLRACEIRAAIELAKFKQIDRDHLFIIGVDCLGTVESKDLDKLTEGDQSFSTESYISAVLSGDQIPIREACRVCPYPVPDNVDMNLGYIGMDPKKEIFVETSPEIAEKLGLKSGEIPDARKNAVSQITQEKNKRREKFFSETKPRFNSVINMLNEFARCKRCYNCRTECPICFCKECVFLTDIFDHGADQYLRWAERKGAIKLPYDTLLFHLTRLNHMATSCVGCGQCSSACPNDLPVFELFQLFGKDVQKIFDYSAGSKLEQEPPILTFREEELDPQ